MTGLPFRRFLAWESYLKPWDAIDIQQVSEKRRISLPFTDDEIWFFDVAFIFPVRACSGSLSNFESACDSGRKFLSAKTRHGCFTVIPFGSQQTEIFFVSFDERGNGVQKFLAMGGHDQLAFILSALLHEYFPHRIQSLEVDAVFDFIDKNGSPRAGCDRQKNS